MYAPFAMALSHCAQHLYVFSSSHIVCNATIFYSFGIPVLTIHTLTLTASYTIQMFACVRAGAYASALTLLRAIAHTPTEFLFVSCIFNASELPFSV